MESLVREDISRIDAVLEARFVHSQVFTQSGGNHGILDLLTVTHSGRLAIVELKASEHIHLPIQAADYWLRIRRHLAQGDFSRYGYLPGVQLQTAAPMVYLVAPALRFHPCDISHRSLRWYAWVWLRAGAAACGLSCANSNGPRCSGFSLSTVGCPRANRGTIMAS
jgi:hypothetical protein